VRIQVVDKAPQQEQYIVPDETKKPESVGMVESPNLVQEDGNEEKSEDAEEQTQDDTHGELWRSKQTRCPSIQDDDLRYSISSYSYQKVPEDLDKFKDSALVMTDPSTYQEAMLRSDAIYWKKAYAKKLEQFVKQKLFSTVRTPVGRKVVGCKWVFKTKVDKNGQVKKYKARLVAQGFSQIPGVDFDKTFAPVTRHQTLRTLLTLANQHCWYVHQMDVKSAFLNGY